MWCVLKLPHLLMHMSLSPPLHIEFAWQRWSGVRRRPRVTTCWASTGAMTRWLGLWLARRGGWPWCRHGWGRWEKIWVGLSPAELNRWHVGREAYIQTRGPSTHYFSSQSWHPMFSNSDACLNPLIWTWIVIFFHIDPSFCTWIPYYLHWIPWFGHGLLFFHIDSSFCTWIPYFTLNPLIWTWIVIFSHWFKLLRMDYLLFTLFRIWLRYNGSSSRTWNP
jgi:hypothetical protein